MRRELHFGGGPAAIGTFRLSGSPRIAVARAGQGDLVLFLHGIGGNKSNWDGQLPIVGRHFTAVAWDARGYGESDDYDGPLAFADLSDDICRILSHFEVPQAHLVGLSMGGRIAFDFAKRFPDAVRSLTICSAVHRASSMTREQRQAFLASRLRPLQEGKSPADIAPGLARSLLGPNASQDAYGQLCHSLMDLRSESYMKALTAVSLYEGDIVLENISAPVHVIAAATDPLFAPETLREMASRIPNCRFTEIADCGHLSNIERPKQFNDALLGFLMKLPGADGETRGSSARGMVAPGMAKH